MAVLEEDIRDETDKVQNTFRMNSRKETTYKGIGVNSSITSGQYMPESSSSNQIVKVNILSNNTH